MKGLLIGLVLIFTTAIMNAKIRAQENIDRELWEKALKIHKEAIVIDTHCDTPMIMMTRGIDIGKKNDFNDVDLIRMKDGGVDAIFFAVFISNEMDDKNPSKLALETIDEIYRQVEKYPELAEMAFSADDIIRISKMGKRAILIGMENGGPIEDSLRLLRIFYRLGVRYITLTHNNNNNISDSSNAKEPKWNGLSDFGKEVVKEMNRLGMMIDVSHISDKAFYDVIELSEAPVIASHSCVRSLCNVPRNMSDDMIKALAKKGGVIQINFFSGFLDEEFYKKSEKIREELKPQIDDLKKKYGDNTKEYWAAAIELWRKNSLPAPKIEVLIDHIDYVVKLVGADYVGLGSDFDGAGSYPPGLEDITGFPLITYHLLKRGYSETDIKKILGGNLLRVFKEVEKRKSKN
jgi:membrane dipeptidase